MRKPRPKPIKNDVENRFSLRTYEKACLESLIARDIEATFEGAVSLADEQIGFGPIFSAGLGRAVLVFVFVPFRFCKAD